MHTPSIFSEYDIVQPYRYSHYECQTIFPCVFPNGNSDQREVSNMDDRFIWVNMFEILEAVRTQRAIECLPLMIVFIMYWS